MSSVETQLILKALPKVNSEIIQVIGIQHDLVAGLALDIGNEAYTTGVFFLGRVIQARLGGKTKLVGKFFAVLH